MTPEQIKAKVEEKIGILLAEFRAIPDKFLTEEDVRAYLYHLLLSDFNALQTTQDGSRSISLHCEIRWYGRSQRLKTRSDIVIFDVAQLKTKDSEPYKLPSKGYGFNNPHVIIEIKLRRINGNSDTKFRNDIIADRTKLQELKTEVAESGHTVHTYLIAFDKKKDISFQTNNTENHKEYYIYKEQNAAN